MVVPTISKNENRNLFRQRSTEKLNQYESSSVEKNKQGQKCIKLYHELRKD